MDPFIGEIRIFGFNYAPQDWAYCNGSEMPVQQAQALYALIANLYGGTQLQTLKVPNLQSMAPMGAATMVDYTYNQLGSTSGTETVQLTTSQLPYHTHALGGEIIAQAAQQSSTPSSSVLPNVVVVGGKISPAFSNASPTTNFAAQTISTTGGNGVHENRQPFIAMNFCICIQGVYPNFG